MNKSNVTKFQCPICKKLVFGSDFISSYRLVEGTTHSYQIKKLCRSCRDSGK